MCFLVKSSNDGDVSNCGHLSFLGFTMITYKNYYRETSVASLLLGCKVAIFLQCRKVILWFLSQTL